MKVDFYEKIWLGAAAVLIVAFAGTVVAGAVAEGYAPPSHVETINPATVWSDARFAHRGVTVDGNHVTVVAIGMTFAFLPSEIHVPAHRPVTFRLTSADVTHGFEIVGTNANTMLIPGYVSQFTVTFDTPGEYLIVCNEYCGQGHHTMSGKLIVEEATP